jgi:hypothetical protein
MNFETQPGNVPVPDAFPKAAEISPAASEAIDAAAAQIAKEEEDARNAAIERANAAEQAGEHSEPVN